MRAPAPGEDQPRARRRAAARRRQARGADRLPAHRPRRPDRRSTAAPELRVEGFAGDTLVRGALDALAARAGVEPRWRVRIEKRIPVAAGLGGGSSDAATALRLANETLAEPLAAGRAARARRAARRRRPVLPRRRPAARLRRRQRRSSRSTCRRTSGSCSCSRTARRRPRPPTSTPRSTRATAPPAGTSAAQALLDGARARCSGPRDLAALPPNDLASLAARRDELRALGAFRADVSGAGPARLRALPPPARRGGREARAAARLGRTWLDGTCVVRLTRAAATRRTPIERGPSEPAAGSASAGSGSRSGSPPPRASSSSFSHDLTKWTVVALAIARRCSPGVAAAANSRSHGCARSCGSSPPRSCSRRARLSSPGIVKWAARSSASSCCAVVGLVYLLRRPPLDFRPPGAWPSGKATGFGPVIPGSNPGAPATLSLTWQTSSQQS